MGWLKCAASAMLIWGTAAFATLPPDSIGGENQELQTIQSWMAHLNIHAQVGVMTNENLRDPNVRKETLRELQLLEEVLRGESALPKGSLMFISCSNIVCGGGDGGKCVKCSADN